ncbi:MAG: 30S ribosome-binding factor RbfA [Clostridia bacterium]|nr:30S ribosome-binding factor RbfA [Clostridia bacterium]
MQPKRLARINSEIKKVVSQIISEDLRDPRLGGLISVMDVDTTNDLSHCTILVSIYSKDKIEVKETFRILNHSSAFIRKLLASRIDLRITPELHFKLDDEFEIDEKMSKLIDSLNIPKENSDE